MAGPLRHDGRCQMGAGCDCEHALDHPDDRPECVNWTARPFVFGHYGCDGIYRLSADEREAIGRTTL